jgi:hypothetical protein
MGRDWGDDDDEFFTEPAKEVPGSPESVYVEDEERNLLRVFPFNHVEHRSTYNRHLVYVDGTPIVDDEGKPYSVWRRDFADVLQSKKVRCIHACMQRPGYRYFVNSKRQQAEFITARDTGMSTRNITFHIYPDEPGVVLTTKKKR